MSQTQSSSSATAATASASNTVGLALAGAGAIAFSAKAIIVKLAYRYDVDAVTLIMLRMVFSLPFFLVMTWWGSRTSRTGSARQQVKLSTRDLWSIFGLGVTGYYLASYLDFSGLTYISASLERLILYLNPTLVLLFGWLLYRQRISLRQALGMAISYAGIFLVFGHEFSLAGSQTMLGSVLVLLSTVSYALYLFYSGEMVQRIGALRLAGMASSVACVLCIAQFAVLRSFSSVSTLAPEVIGLSMVNAVLCTVIPVLLVMMAIERIGSTLAAQVGMLGPMSTITMGVIILGEPFNAWVVAGTVCVLVGVFVCSNRGASSTPSAAQTE